MVVAGKIFKVTDPLPIIDIASRLTGYRIEEPYEEGDYKFTLITEVVNLQTKPDVLTGTYSTDYIIHVFHRGTSAPMARTVEAMFSFAKAQDAVVEKKRVANLIANKLSEVLFGKIGAIIEAKIPPDILSDFHNRNPEDTKITFFDNIDIPNVDKLSLYGLDLNNTSLFDDYMKHGSLWYIVARSKETGYVVGITRDASVTIFNIVDKNKYVEYVTKEIYPIIPA